MNKKIFLNDPFLVKIENVFDETFCSSIVNKYEELVNNNIEEVNSLSICKTGNVKTCNNCDCLRVDLMQHDVFKEDRLAIAQKLFDVVDFYKSHTGVTDKQFPEKYAFENLKIKRYLPNTDQGMLEHIDVFSQATGKRFLAFVIYLNDDFDGGETVFHKHNLSIKPTTGSVVVFPPYWPWLHSAEKVKGTNAKYFLGSYLQYMN